MPEKRRFVFTGAWMRRLGVSDESLKRHMAGMEADGLLPDTVEQVDMTDATEMFSRLRAEKPTAYCEADQAGADWMTFFENLIKWIKELLPLFLKGRKKIAALVT